jgi:hypothetical protein
MSGTTFTPYAPRSRGGGRKPCPFLRHFVLTCGFVDLVDLLKLLQSPHSCLPLSSGAGYLPCSRARNDRQSNRRHALNVGNVGNEGGIIFALNFFSFRIPIPLLQRTHELYCTAVRCSSARSPACRPSRIVVHVENGCVDSSVPRSMPFSI